MKTKNITIWCPICGIYEERWDNMNMFYIEIENWMGGKSTVADWIIIDE